MDVCKFLDGLLHGENGFITDGGEVRANIAVGSTGAGSNRTGRGFGRNAFDVNALQEFIFRKFETMRRDPGSRLMVPLGERRKLERSWSDHR